MTRLADEHFDLLRKVVLEHRQNVRNRFMRLLEPVATNFIPPRLEEYLQELERVAEYIGQARLRGSRPGLDIYLPLLRNAIIERRLEIANRVEERKAKTIHPSVLAQLDSELSPYDVLVKALLSEHVSRGEEKWRLPQLTEFFPVEIVEKEILKTGEPQQREYDEKFHILQAPALFLPDLVAARTAGALRGISIGVAYLDIDHFKAFNTDKGEPFVDRNVLPTLMRFLEAHVYMRGYAYRYGGDEYAVLLNNTTAVEAASSMERLRAGIADLKYSGCDRSTTVSIGLVIVSPECHLTGREIESAAALAKKFAKDNGRNRVASYRSLLLREKDLELLGGELPPS